MNRLCILFLAIILRIGSCCASSLSCPFEICAEATVDSLKIKGFKGFKRGMNITSNEKEKIEFIKYYDFKEFKNVKVMVRYDEGQAAICARYFFIRFKGREISAIKKGAKLLKLKKEVVDAILTYPPNEKKIFKYESPSIQSEKKYRKVTYSPKNRQLYLQEGVCFVSIHGGKF